MLFIDLNEYTNISEQTAAGLDWKRTINNELWINLLPLFCIILLHVVYGVMYYVYVKNRDKTKRFYGFLLEHDFCILGTRLNPAGAFCLLFNFSPFIEALSSVHSRLWIWSGNWWSGCVEAWFQMCTKYLHTYDAMLDMLLPSKYIPTTFLKSKIMFFRKKQLTNNFNIYKNRHPRRITHVITIFSPPPPELITQL